MRKKPPKEKEYRCECGRNLTSGPQYWDTQLRKWKCEKCYKQNDTNRFRQPATTN